MSPTDPTNLLHPLRYLLEDQVAAPPRPGQQLPVPMPLGLDIDQLVVAQWRDTCRPTNLRAAPGDAEAIRLLACLGPLTSDSLHSAAYAPHGAPRRATEMRLPRLHANGLVRACDIDNQHRRLKPRIYVPTRYGVEWAASQLGIALPPQPSSRKPQISQPWHLYRDLTISTSVLRLSLTGAPIIDLDADPRRQRPIRAPRDPALRQPLATPTGALHCDPDSYRTIYPAGRLTLHTKRSGAVRLLLIDLDYYLDIDPDRARDIGRALDAYISDPRLHIDRSGRTSSPPVCIAVTAKDDHVEALLWMWDRALTTRIDQTAGPRSRSAYPGRMRILVTSRQQLLTGELLCWRVPHAPPELRSADAAEPQARRLLPGPSTQPTQASIPGQQALIPGL